MAAKPSVNQRGGSGGRRTGDFKDEEARMWAMQANEKADAALKKIDTHMEVCENDNKHIKDKLDRQDKLLFWIIGLIVSGLGALALEFLTKK